MKKKYIGHITVDHNTNDEQIKNDINYGLKYNLKQGLCFLLRIKNESNTILKNIYSICNFADEIIIVDNGSTDATCKIIGELEQKYENIFVYHYNIKINTVGNNNINNYRTKISTFYNWGLSKVSRYNVIKWDGDFVAIKHNLAYMINRYNLCSRSDHFSLWFGGLTRFYDNYTNLSSYYDEYRCFSKLHGFKWEDSIRCETSLEYIKNCEKRLVIGYDTINNPIWLHDKARIFDFNKKPIFIEHKNISDYKENIVDERCIIDNHILLLYKDSQFEKITNDVIIFIICQLPKENNDLTLFNKILFVCLNYSDNDVRLIYCDKTSTDNDDIIKKYGIDNFKNKQIKIIISSDIFSCTDLAYFFDLKYIEIYGVIHSDQSDYSKYFIDNCDYFKNIIVVNETVYNNYKNILASKTILLKNNILVPPITKRIKDKIKRNKKEKSHQIKILYFSDMVYEKNLIIMMMYAIDKLADNNNNILFDAYTNIDQTIDQTNIQTIIHYHNSLKNKNCIKFFNYTDDRSIYLNYDICVLTSIFEGFSYNILEAIYYEIPILCTNIPTNREIIKDYLPMFNFGIDNMDNPEELALFDPHLPKNKGKIDNICNVISHLITNYDFYSNNVISLKKNITAIYFDIKQYITKISNIFCDRNYINYPEDILLQEDTSLHASQIYFNNGIYNGINSSIMLECIKVRYKI